MKQEELNTILDEHELWVKSCATKGKRADLSGEHLEGLAFDDRALSQASFRGAYLDGTKFIDAILVGVDFEGASFAQANLTEASLEDAQNIDLAEFDNTVGIYPVCPDTGSFTGWTLAEDSKGNDFLIKAMIPWQAKRSSGTTRKCRTNKLYIDKIFTINGEDVPKSFRLKNRDVKTAVGESLVDDDYEVDRFKVSSTDLYFYITKEEALAQARKRI